MKPKYEPKVYAALRGVGWSNRKIGQILNISEASVRRGLHGFDVSQVENVKLLAVEDRLANLERQVQEWNALMPW